MRLTRGKILTALLLSLACGASAGPMVGFTAPFAGGFFNYNLTLDNVNSTLIVSGLIVVNGYANSGGTVVFGLGPGSVIGAPPEANGCPCEAWSFLPPIPPFANALSYASPDDGGDISPGGTLSGFTFQSLEDPATLHAGDFDIVLIVRGGTTMVDIGDAFQLPEPSEMVPGALALGLAFVLRRRSKAA